MLSTKPGQAYYASTRVGQASTKEAPKKDKKDTSKKKKLPYFLLRGKPVVARGPVVPFGQVRYNTRWVRVASPLGELRLVYHDETTCDEMKRCLRPVSTDNNVFQSTKNLAQERRAESRTQSWVESFFF
jgi:hypothetical protein